MKFTGTAKLSPTAFSFGYGLGLAFDAAGEHDLTNKENLKTPQAIQEAHRRGLISDRTRNELMVKHGGMRAAP